MVPKKAQCVLQEASAGGSVAGTLMFERLEDDMDSIMITGAVSGGFFSTFSGVFSPFSRRLSRTFSQGLSPRQCGEEH